MPTDLERLAFLGVDPAALDPAPDRPARGDWWPRIDVWSPDRRRCCSCRALAVATRVVDIPGCGRRWHDQCRDCMIAGGRMNWDAGEPQTGRYKVTVEIGGRPVMQGWWETRASADAKHTEWIGAWGKPGARITLDDEETGETLTTWPEQP